MRYLLLSAKVVWRNCFANHLCKTYSLQIPILCHTLSTPIAEVNVSRLASLTMSHTTKMPLNSKTFPLRVTCRFYDIMVFASVVFSSDHKTYLAVRKRLPFYNARREFNKLSSKLKHPAKLSKDCLDLVH